MILTITLSPALDRYISEDGAVISERLGGKGINVSKNLDILGLANIASGFSFGDSMGGYLDELSLNNNFFSAGDNLRVNLKIYKNGEITEQNSIGQLTDKTAEIKLLAYITETATKLTAVAISGSLPLGCDPQIYSKIITICKKHSIPVFADSSGAALSDILSSSPYLIKPNIREFESVTGKSFNSKLDIAISAQEMCKNYDIKLVCVSLGSSGAIIADMKNAYYVAGQKVSIKNTVGLGDAMVAILIKSYQDGESSKTSLINAVCYASAIGASDNATDILTMYKKLSGSIPAQRLI